MIRRFTGWHMLVLMLAFFSVVIAVNATMATLAALTFGGKVVENSYVASQEFNGWLDRAKAQDALGWTMTAQAVDRRLVIDAAAAAPLAGATVTVRASHPLGVVPEVALRFSEVAPGRYVASTRLPAGRWRLHVDIRRGGDRAAFVREVHA